MGKLPPSMPVSFNKLDDKKWVLKTDVEKIAEYILNREEELMNRPGKGFPGPEHSYG